MRAMSGTAVLVGALLFGGCATTGSSGTSSPGDQPVGTTGAISREPAQVETSERGVIPVGQEIDVRLQTTLNSGTATTEQRFQTTQPRLQRGQPCVEMVHGLVRPPSARHASTGRRACQSVRR